MLYNFLYKFIRSYHFSILYTGRVLGGVGVGSIYIIVPKYVQDLTSLKQRKVINNCMYGATIVGALFEYTSGKYNLLISL